MAINNPTTNYGWTMPTVGGDAGAWGNILNELIGGDGADTHDEGIDFVINAVSTVANAALPKAGGTMTGDLVALAMEFAVVNLGATLSGAEAMDLAAGNVFYGTCTGATITFSFSNESGGANAEFVVLRLTNGGVSSITWPAGTTWPGGAQPPLTAAGTDIIVFMTLDGGTTWHAALVQENIS